MQYNEQNAQGNFIQSIVNKNSKPTKNKVKTFKSRVFHLLVIYASKATNLSPLLKSLSKQVLFQETQKINELAKIILQKPQLNHETIKTLAELYKQLVLYDKRGNSNSTNIFLQLIKKLQKEQLLNMIGEMFTLFLTSRKAKIRLPFFTFILRKITGLKSFFLDKCNQIQSKQKLRPAQQRQLVKFKAQLLKHFKNSKIQAVQ